MEIADIEVIAVAAAVLLLIGFTCGYGVRALMSRWHRAKAARRRFEFMAEEVMQNRKQERLAITFQKGESTQVRPEGGAS